MKKNKYLVCCLLMVREHSFIFYSWQNVLMERVHNFFIFILIFFSNKRANPKTKELIWCGLKSRFFFSENGFLKDSFQETINNFSIIFNGFVHKIDQKLHIQKFPLTGP